MQHPVFSIIMAPLIYTMVRMMTDNTELYHQADLFPDMYRAMFLDREDTFDFIVVGAGSSGAVVANRLVKNNFKVLLIEAGGEMMPAQYIPSTSLLMLDKPQLDWAHLTVPQTKSCFALKNKQALWSAGKGLGGTSLLNFLQYIRGHQKDFDAWANITNDPSWSYEGVIPHFQAVEDFHGEFESQDVHGHGGEVTVQPPPYRGMQDYFMQAVQEKGILKRDLNGRYDEGASPIYNNIRNGRRVSTFNAFIEPIRNDKNFFIHKFSEVTKILIRGDENEAYGVEYNRHGMRKVAFARNEVILSTGLVNSPKLLMLSGIGPGEHLASLGIQTKYDNPAVGKNVQDHASVYLGPFLVDQPVSMLLDRDINSETMTEFIDHGTGPLTSSGTLATALISSEIAKANGEGDWPDIQWILVGTGIYQKFAEDFARGFHVKEDVLKKYLRSARGQDSFQIIVSGNRPFQRGDIFLRSSNPKDEPIIDPRYFHDERDLEVIVEGIKRAIDLVENTTAFQSIGARYTDEVFPGCENVPFRSDDYFRCLTRHYTITLHHLVGSCSMGRADSKDAVVDPQLRVIGVKNLRVIDASVMPLVPNVNTHSASMMVGQKGAYEILQHWRQVVDNEVKK